jgi:DeoR family transcriptional regulator, ulaG and ulaABCDEF operon transcriptional repressor
MHKSERHSHILDRLNEYPYLSVGKLAEELHISAVTIRRDLSELAAGGRIKRLHGGAGTSGHARPSLIGESFKRNLTRNVAAKRAIARAAAAMVHPGDSIIIDGGTTTFQMARYLNNIDLQVVTNSIHIVQSLIDDPAIRVVVPAGEVFREQNIILSSFEDDGLNDYVATTMFMGAEAITAQGIQQSDPLLIRAEQQLRRHAQRLIVLADSSKFASAGRLLFCPLDKVDQIITDKGISADQVATIEAAGGRICIA